MTIKFSDPNPDLRKADWHARRAGTGAKNASLANAGKYYFRGHLSNVENQAQEISDRDKDFAFR